MSSPEYRSMNEITVDTDNLYKEDLFTDLKIASIRRMVPVRADGSPDESRETLYVGQTTLMSQAGPVPISCPIEAQNLEEAMEKFPAAVNEAVERLIEEAREIQRQESSRIVVPGMAPGAGGKIIP